MAINTLYSLLNSFISHDEWSLKWQTAWSLLGDFKTKSCLLVLNSVKIATEKFLLHYIIFQRFHGNCIIGSPWQPYDEDGKRRVFSIIIVVRTWDISSQQFFKCTVQALKYLSVKYKHQVVQQISRTHSSYITETIYPLKSNSPFSPTPNPWQLPFYFLFLQVWQF